MNKQNTIIFESNGQTLHAKNPEYILKAHTKQELNELIQHINQDLNKNKQPHTNTFTEGYIGYISYEATYPLLNIATKHTPKLPLAWFGKYTNKNITPYKHIPLHTKKLNIQPTQTKETYTTHIQAIQRYIKNGSTYQINHTQPFISNQVSNLMQYYKKTPYAAYLNTKETTLLSLSPECALTINKNTITTKPIKGSIKRGKTKNEDLQQRNRLKQSKKNNAECLMITDLMRNDLGKICQTGSIKTEKINEIETHPYIHHLASTITGELKPNQTHLDALLSIFPGGSITGAPKYRSIEIIQETEPYPREIYTGCIGYLSYNQNTQFNIAIRTLYTHNNTLYVHTGGGITSDSTPEDEWDECLLKLKAFNINTENII